MNKGLEEVEKRLKKIINAKSGCSYEIALFDFGEHAEAVLKELERLQKENEDLKLEKRSRIIGKYGEIETHDLINKTLQEDYIEKDKIREKTKEIQEEYELLLEHQNGQESNRTKYLRGKIHMGQELLKAK